MVPKRMMQKAEEMIKRAYWYSDFIQFDLNELSDDKENLLIVQALSIVYGMGLIEIGKNSRPDMPADRWKNATPLNKAVDIWKQEKKLKLCQQRLRQFYEQFMKGIEKLKAHAQEWKPIPTNYHPFDHMQLYFEVQIETPLIKLEKPIIINNGEENKQVLYRLSEEDLLNSQPRVDYRTEKDEDNLLHDFYRVLEFINIGAHRQCPECGRYFIHLSKKAKIYCSNPCASKYKQKQNRRDLKEAEPETYRQYLADEADRKRRELVKNTPRGRRKRNPYKYKDSKEP